MPYCTTDLVQADFKELPLTTTSLVKIADVTQFIVEADALINSYVGQRYTVPVASGNALELLKLYSRSLVTARIKRLLEVKQEKNTDANQNVVGVLLSPSMVMKLLADIRDGSLALAGATLLNSSGAFYSKNVVDEVEAVIKKDERQW